MFHVIYTKSLDNADELGRIRPQVVEVCRVHDALPVQLPQVVDDGLDTFGGNAGDSIGVVLLELLHQVVAGRGIEVVVGLESLHQTVALLLHRGLVLVDGEVEVGGEVVVAPHILYLHPVGRIAVAGHEPYDYRHCRNHKRHAQGHVAPRQITV